MLAAGVLEGLAAADAELLQRLEAIGGKAGRGDGDALDAAHSDKRERRVGRGLEPFRPAEARLEGDIDLAPERLGQAAARSSGNGSDRDRQDRACARGMPWKLSSSRSGSKSSAASWRARFARKRLDVERIVIIRRQRAQRGLHAHRASAREHRVIRGRRRRRAILRIERRCENARAAFSTISRDRRGDAGIAVAHRVMDADAGRRVRSASAWRCAMTRSGEPSLVQIWL